MVERAATAGAYLEATRPAKLAGVPVHSAAEAPIHTCCLSLIGRLCTQHVSHLRVALLLPTEWRLPQFARGFKHVERLLVQWRVISIRPDQSHGLVAAMEEAITSTGSGKKLASFSATSSGGGLDPFARLLKKLPQTTQSSYSRKLASSTDCCATGGMDSPTEPRWGRAFRFPNWCEKEPAGGRSPRHFGRKARCMSSGAPALIAIDRCQSAPLTRTAYFNMTRGCRP